jgi:hypothetical protein
MYVHANVQNRTYDLKYDTGLRENCVERERMREALGVGQTVKCVVRREVLAREARLEAELAETVRKATAGQQQQQQTRSPLRSPRSSGGADSDADGPNAWLKRGRIIKMHAGAYDVLFDEPAVQVRRWIVVRSWVGGGWADWLRREAVMMCLALACD